jgi:SNF2 family DNA or RNA helicase
MNEQHFGACLADDMGLGKTIQVLTYLQYRKETCEPIPISGHTADQESALRNQLNLFKHETLETIQDSGAQETHSCSLVVVPTSLIYNWLSEAKKYSNLKVYVHTGFNRTRHIKEACKLYDIVVSSYGTVRNDIDLFSKIEFNAIVLDESQAIKNPSSQTAASVNQLRARHKIVMTGTPVENSITDLWSQINFLNPGILGNFNYFSKKFVSSIEKEGNEEDTKCLKDIVRPFILRRTKEQVASDLPSKTEKIVLCVMSEEQKQKYESIRV